MNSWQGAALNQRAFPLQSVNELSSQVGQQKVQETGSRIRQELTGLERGESKQPECQLLRVIVAVWRTGDGPKGEDLVTEGILSKRSQSPLSLRWAWLR